MKKKINKDKPSRGKLVKKLDAVFSQYIRLRDSDVNGYCKCFTCGQIDFWKNMQNGHFVSRSNYKYRWHESNCNVQCKCCNIFKHGNYIQYTLNMIKLHGEYMVNVISKDKSIEKIQTSKLEEMIDSYEHLVKAYISQKHLDYIRPKPKTVKIQHN